MFRLPLLLGGAAIGMLAIAYGLWWWMMQGDVVRLQKTIDYRNQQIATANRATKLVVQRVHAVGFPLHSRVRIEQPSLQYDFNDEHYSVTLDYLDFTSRDSDQGSYAITYPTSFSAEYQKTGQAAEHYSLNVNPFIPVLVRAQGNSQECSNFPGQKPCDPVTADAPLISFAAQLPSNADLQMTLNGKTQTRNFQLPSVQIPIYETIPADLQSPMEIFINVLREVMVDHM